jgi:YidC/Oxa1 family membrane protein insertase
MDRTGWFFVILATIGLVIALWWQQQQATEQRVRQQQQQIAQAVSPTATPAPSVAATPNVGAATTQPIPEQRQVVPDQEATLKDSVAVLRFSNNRGGLSAVELLQHKAEHDQPVSLNTPTAPAIGAITQSPNDWNDSGYELSSDATTGTATLKRSTPENLEITKAYTLAGKAGLVDEYQTKLSITFKNNGDSEYKSPGYFVSTGAAEQIHSNDRPMNTQFDWYREGKNTAIDVNWFGPKSFLFFQTGPGQDVYVQKEDKILWAAVSNQYFTTILAPTNTAGTQAWARRVSTPTQGTEPPMIGIQGALEIPAFSLAPGESKTIDFAIYSGPKEYGRLARLPNDQTDVMNFGFFKWISVLLLTSLNTLHLWVKSYALAIIIMTIIIRTLLWPIQNASTKSMRKMAKLSPLINELRVKYKDDPQRMNQETMKLYKEYGVNPFGGCIPMLIQIPIFFGFYGMLDKAIELRNSTFLWVHDLSQPDTVFHLANIPINILPLVMAGTQVWQMSITPKTGDPAQQRILLFMPVIFLFICYNYASALALYWTVQNLFFVAQMYLTRNQVEPQLAKVPKSSAVAKKKSYR